MFCNVSSFRTVCFTRSYLADSWPLGSCTALALVTMAICKAAANLARLVVSMRLLVWRGCSAFTEPLQAMDTNLLLTKTPSNCLVRGRMCVVELLRRVWEVGLLRGVGRNDVEMMWACELWRAQN